MGKLRFDQIFEHRGTVLIVVTALIAGGWMMLHSYNAASLAERRLETERARFEQTQAIITAKNDENERRFLAVIERLADISQTNAATQTAIGERLSEISGRLDRSERDSRQKVRTVPRPATKKRKRLTDCLKRTTETIDYGSGKLLTRERLVPTGHCTEVDSEAPTASESNTPGPARPQ